ncbi:IS110 family transposase [Vibrio parahaemolyticus]|uniref:IS110 family transposase n=1 Tax=Vibrio parahaemolyticus TaxID=670 RepID=UPI00235FA93F|nr:IS110 family transposase [Vibrio parahaemolyticus]
MNVKVVGIDLAKNVFQVCVLLNDGNIAWNRKITRTKLLHTLRQFPAKTLIAMEACSTSHHWARQFIAMGHTVYLIPAQHVKPFVGRQKNDANDARAICEATFRPSIHPVRVKSLEQQDIKALRSVRSRFVEQRTATANQIRGLCSEYGVSFPVGIRKLREGLSGAIEDGENGLSFVVRRLLRGLYDDLITLDHDIEALTNEITILCKTLPRYQALLSIPGYGPIVAATFMSEIGDGLQFKNGRQLSAWCGLVPRQSSSGGKECLGRISKNGSSELRMMLIHGARAVSRFSAKRDDSLGAWFNALVKRQGKHKAIVALANKLARIGWRILVGKKDFDSSLAFNAALS